ncbi:uncharacterized protein LOC126557241 [Anopheles maculipalpis]|uniref:uncharacterized protein LOC126557241 n=1 Tax=Anopheles maculipalpis TaxID=1496333 RepID=UPI002158E0ED|nr:uncharacterized protein LOC126557241 [Anopheles maculipalpis]
MNRYKYSDMKMQCITKMLSSRRMFADHLELAELSLKLDAGSTESPLPVATFKVFGSGCILSIAAATRCWFSRETARWQLVASTTSALVLGAMAYGSYCYHDDLTKVDTILATFEAYDGALKKMMLCIKEMFYGNDRIGFIGDIREVQQEMFFECAENSTKAIFALYDYVKKLEAKMKLHEQFVKIYDPMESLANCDVFQQTVGHQGTMRELYNIFLYMQSHCLMLLTLSFASDMTLGVVKDETNSFVGCIKQLTAALKRQFALIPFYQADISNCTLHEPSRVNQKELIPVKQQSLELAAKLSVNIQHAVALDQTIQAIEDVDSQQDRIRLEQAVNNLVNFQAYLSTRLDECDRLIITIKKLLYCTEPNTINGDNQQSAPLLIDPEEALHMLMREQQEELLAAQDEFFLNTGTEPEEQDDDGCAALYNLELEDEHVAKRMMKNRFTPVLAQLRERLVPVGESFRERERAALQLKGIRLMDELEPVTQQPLDSDEEGDGAIEYSAVKYEYRCSQNKYNKDRDFLASKSQFSLFANPPTAALEENILE